MDAAGLAGLSNLLNLYIAIGGPGETSWPCRLVHSIKQSSVRSYALIPPKLLGAQTSQ